MGAEHPHLQSAYIYEVSDRCEVAVPHGDFVDTISHRLGTSMALPLYFVICPSALTTNADCDSRML